MDRRRTIQRGGTRRHTRTRRQHGEPSHSPTVENSLVNVPQNADAVKENVEIFWGRKETITEVNTRVRMTASVQKTGEMLGAQVRGRPGLQGGQGGVQGGGRVTIVTAWSREQGLPARG